MSRTRTAGRWWPTVSFLALLPLFAWGVLEVGGVRAGVAEREAALDRSRREGLRDTVLAAVSAELDRECLRLELDREGHPVWPLREELFASEAPPGESASWHRARQLELQGRPAAALAVLEHEGLDPARSTRAYIKTLRLLAALGRADEALARVDSLDETTGRERYCGLPIAILARLMGAEIESLSQRGERALALTRNLRDGQWGLSPATLEIIVERLSALPLGATPEADTIQSELATLAAAARVAGALSNGWRASGLQPIEGAALGSWISPAPETPVSAPAIRITACESLLRVATAYAEHHGLEVSPADSEADLEADSEIDAAAAARSLALGAFPLRLHGFEVLPSRERLADRLALAAKSLGLLGLLGLFVGQVATLHNARREARRARRERELADAIGHELRTPLTALSLRAERLAAPTLLEPTRRRHADALRRDVARLQELVERLARFARMDRGLSESGAPLEPRRAVADALREVRPRLRECGLRIRVLVPRLLPPCRGDHTAVTRAVVNLIENAIRYAPQSGTLELSVRKATDGIRWILEDRGPGFAGASTEQLLEPFVRGADARRAALPGSGLGLALVAATARAHGGAVRLTERRGGGASVTFSLALPRRRRPTTSRPRSSPIRGRGT